MKIQIAILKALLLTLALLFSPAGCGGGSSSDGGNDRGLSNNACPILGLNTRGHNTRIINGTPCGESSSPIVQVNTLTIDAAGLCSGTLLTPTTVLTAAHCFFGIVLDSFVEVNGVRAGVSEIISHPDVSIDPVTFAVFNDAAIVRLSSALPGRALPILGSRSVSNGDIVSIFGYGLDNDGNSDVLRSGEMRVSDVNSNHVSAAFNGEGSNTCNGDSGGPAVFTFTNGDGVEVDAIVGLVSSGELISCREGDRTLFTNVNSDSVMSFITSTVPGVGVQ